MFWKITEIECPKCGERSKNECEKEFTSKSGLIVHIRSAHGGVRYNCDQCEKNFQIPHGLKAHKAVSHNENKYKCQKCEKVMKSARWEKHKYLSQKNMIGSLISERGAISIWKTNYKEKFVKLN